jgi:hypothetical protein
MKKQEKVISDELIDGMLKQGRTAEDVNALLKRLAKAVLERARGLTSALISTNSLVWLTLNTRANRVGGTAH